MPGLEDLMAAEERKMTTAAVSSASNSLNNAINIFLFSRYARDNGWTKKTLDEFVESWLQMVDQETTEAMEVTEKQLGDADAEEREFLLGIMRKAARGVGEDFAKNVMTRMRRS